MRVRRAFFPAGGLAAFGFAVAFVAFGAASAPVAHAADPVPASVLLRRASMQWSTGDVRGAVRTLEMIDFANAATDSSGALPRAALLRVAGALQLGDRESFERAFEAAAFVPSASAESRWIAVLAASARGEVIEVPPLVRRWMDALAADASGTPDASRWRDLASMEAKSPLERELAGAASLRAATDALESGRADDADEVLAKTPSVSSSARRAHRMRALLAFERGDSAAAHAALAEAASGSFGSTEDRAVALAGASTALDDARWDEAARTIESIDASWRAQADAIDRFAAQGLEVPVDWDAWLQERPGSIALVADAAASSEAFARALDTVVRGDPAALPAPPPASFGLALQHDGFGFALPAPDSARAAAARVLAAERSAASGRVDAAVDALLQERAEIARRLAYLERGAEKTGREAQSLRALLTRIDALIASTDDALRKLERLRDEEIRRIAERTALFRKRCEENDVIARAIRRWRVEGPNRLRPEILAPGVPAPAEILEQEIALADTVRAWVDGFARIMPDLVTRSHAEIWEPRAREGPLALSRAAKDALAWVDRLDASIDSSMAYARAPERLAPFEETIRGARAELARLEDQERAVRTELLAAAVDDARRAHDAEGEGIAYLQSIAAYELAVLEAQDRLREGAGGAAPPLPATRGPHARAVLAAFLDRHPESGGRSEIRYRLADLEILRAREDFQSKMASFLGHDPASAAATGAGASDAAALPRGTTALAPFVDYDPALALYRALLEDDPEFEHRDAVLFQAGMILSDQADPSARELLGELVASHPGSPFRGRAALRLGDDDFERRELADAAVHFEAAATSDDAEVRPIALYKLGWVHFNRDAHEDAAASFLRLLELYEADSTAFALTDLRREGEESLVHALAGADGPRTFAALFGEEARRSFDARVLGGLASTLVGANQYDDAAACDSLLLERHPLAPEALDTARHLVATMEEASRPDRAMDARLALAPRFTRDSAWGRAAPSDSLRAAGDTFARASIETVALERHAAAREAKNDSTAWKEALVLHGRLLEGWPEDPARTRTYFLAGEAAAALGLHDEAIASFERAAADTGALAVDAAWQLVAVRDAAYTSAVDSKSGSAGDRSEALLKEIDRFVATRSADPRALEALWRKGDVARRHDRLEESAAAYGAFLDRAPRDPRAPDAAHAAARALFDAERFASAGDAYDRAVHVARAAGADSLAAALEPLVPLCAFKEAETVEADASRAAEAGRLFDRVAQRWPAYEFADRALYRAGLDHARGGSAPDAVRSWNTLIEMHPKSDLTRDAYLQIASTWKASERPEAAARAYERFSEAYPDDPEAQDALLEAADLLATAGDEPAAEVVRSRYLERYPDDLDTAFAVLGARAEKELRAVGPDQAVGALSKRKESALGRYLELAQQHPDLASRPILAQVRYLEAEETRRAYDAARLTQPIGASIAAKKKLLESVLGTYRQCVEMAAEPWSVAGAYRIGESLVNFGDALRESARPADLTGDDLAAYEEVLETQSWEFYDRGEETWTELLKSAKPSTDDARGWLVKTREELWPRIAKRFVHRPEMTYPLVTADPPKSTAPTSLSRGEGENDVSGS